MTRNLPPLLAIAIASAAFGARGQPPLMQAEPPAVSAPAATLGEVDSDFVREMAQFGQGLLRASILALLKSGDQRVRDFARTVLDNQEQVNIRLLRLGEARGVKIAREPSAMHLSQLELLRQATGRDFDRQFLRAFGVESQRWALRLVHLQLDKGSDPEVIRFAKEISPELQQNLHRGTALAASIGAGSSRTSKHESVPARAG